jgi:hypothetical protein
VPGVVSRGRVGGASVPLPVTIVIEQLPSVLADAAAELEAKAEDKPSLSSLREVKDLEPAIVTALEKRCPTRVQKSKKIKIPQWTKVGNVDVIVRREPSSNALALAAELKWSWTYDKVYEAIWDLFKMALLATRPDVDATVLITGASPKEWDSTFCGDLFHDGTHHVTEICARRFLTGSKRLAWDYLVEGGHDGFPGLVPASISTELVAVQPVKHAEACWELRAVRVRPAQEAFVTFSDGWPEGSRPSDARRPLPDHPEVLPSQLD